MTLQVRDGVVRLEPRDWHEIVDAGAAALPAEAAALPGFVEAIAATRGPLVQVQLDVANARLAVRHQCWVSLEAVAFLAHVRGEEHQLMAFPPAFLPHAFERFARADPARGEGGTGLGLAIVDAIAAGHGGSGHIANHPEGGADVWITLPPVARPAGEVRQEPAAATSAG